MNHETATAGALEHRVTVLAIRADRAQTEIALIDEVLHRRQDDDAAGPGHLWTPRWPIPSLDLLQSRADEMTYLVAGSRLSSAWHRYLEAARLHDPKCRVCGSWLSSIRSREACPGDQHACTAPDPDGTKALHRGDTLCGRPGSYNADLTVWTCQAGHRTNEHCPDYPSRNGTGPGCAWLSCPCQFLPTEIPGPVGHTARGTPFYRF